MHSNARSTKQARCSWCGPCHKGSAGGAPRRSHGPASPGSLLLESRPVQISKPTGLRTRRRGTRPAREATDTGRSSGRTRPGESRETAGPAERKVTAEPGWGAEGKRGQGAEAEGCELGSEDPPGSSDRREGAGEWGAPVTCIV